MERTKFQNPSESMKPRKKNGWRGTTAQSPNPDNASTLLETSQISETKSFSYNQSGESVFRVIPKPILRQAMTNTRPNQFRKQLPLFYYNPHPSHIDFDFRFQKDANFRADFHEGYLRNLRINSIDKTLQSEARRNDLSSKRQSEIKDMNPIVRKQIQQILESSQEKTMCGPVKTLADSDLRESLAIFEKKDLSQVPDLSFASEDKFNCSKSSIMKNETIVLFEESDLMIKTDFRKDLINREMGQYKARFNDLDSAENLDADGFDLKYFSKENFLLRNQEKFEISTVNNFKYRKNSDKENLVSKNAWESHEDRNNDMSDLRIDTDVSGISIIMDPRKMVEIMERRVKGDSQELRQNFRSLIGNKSRPFNPQNYQSNQDNKIMGQIRDIHQKRRKKAIKAKSQPQKFFKTQNPKEIRGEIGVCEESCSYTSINSKHNKKRLKMINHNRAKTSNLYILEDDISSKFERQRQIYKRKRRQSRNISSPRNPPKNNFSKCKSPFENNQNRQSKPKISPKYGLQTRFQTLRYTRAISDPQKQRLKRRNPKQQRKKSQKVDLKRVNRRFSISSLIKKMDLASYRLDQQMNRIDHLKKNTPKNQRQNSRGSQYNVVLRRFSALRKNSLKCCYRGVKK